MSLHGRSLVAVSIAIAAFVACSDDPDGVAQNSGGAAGNTAGSAGRGGASGSGGGGAGASGSSGSSTGGVSGGAGVAGSGGVAGSSQDLCQQPAGNLLAHGDFEEGMSGEAPAFWEVRDPAAPANCAGSGAPSEHVFPTAPAPGCTGQALAIDARGQWDCYAVQRVSDYNSIQGGATYRVSAVVRSTGNAVNPAAWFVVGVQWLDANDQFFGDEKNPQTASAAENDYDWKVLSFELTAPANATRMLVWLPAHYPGRVDYDNLSVVKL